MEKELEVRIRRLVDDFGLLRTKEGSALFDKKWNELINDIPLEEKKEAGRILREEMASRRNYKSDVRNSLGELADVLNMSYIAREYFHKDRSWLAQRINGNIVNGKVAAFSEAELKMFRSALENIKNRLSETISNI